jgi:hypothetical protein
MKNKLSLIISIVFFVIIVSFIFLYISFSNTTWGGWKPPSTELELSNQEINWKNKIEQKYDCKFEFIGLDDAFMEDSIIYMRIYCNENSNLNKLLDEDLNQISSQFSKSFLKISQDRPDQKYIQYTFENVFDIKNDTLKRHPLKVKSLFSIITNQIN